MIVFRKTFPQSVVGVKVYLEGKRSRFYVGKLFCRTKNVKTIFYFEYEVQYLNYEKSIPVGPELPLTKLRYRSETLFPSFQDRIPSRENVAYAEYCASTGISVTETNPLVLLSTIGKRGPSSFVFEPILKDDFSARDLKQYRLELDLSIRDFAMLFDLSPSHLQRIESDTYEGKKTLEQIKLLRNNLPVLISKIKENAKMHPGLKKDLMEKITIKMKKNIIESAQLLKENQGFIADWQKAIIGDAVVYCYAGKYAATYELLNLINGQENKVDSMNSITSKVIDKQEIELEIQKLISNVEPFIMLRVGEAFWQNEIQPVLILPCEIKVGKIYLAFSREVVDDYFLLKGNLQGWEERAALVVGKEVSSNPEFKLIVIRKIENDVVQQQLTTGQIPLIQVEFRDFGKNYR
jgi:HipA-like protein